MWRIGIEHFCLACHKQHNSTVWHYRPSVEGVTKEWLCGIKYLVLDPEETESGRHFRFCKTRQVFREPNQTFTYSSFTRVVTTLCRAV